MNEQLISLDCLDANPYQPRQSEDFNVVLEIAMNILGNATEEFDGLLQAPTVRPIAGGRYQLAFGHTRKAAFAELVNQGHERYSQMRAYVRELSDVQMFEMAVAENIKRRDLNPIEQAESMRRYMDEFGKTSVEAGEFFGVSEETIRAKVRLGNLTEPLKEKVRTGEISENAARSALTMTRVLPGDEIAVREFMRNILEDNDKPEDALRSVLRSANRTKIIGGRGDNAHFSMQAKTFKYLPELTLAEAIKEFELNSERVIWEGYLDALYKGRGSKTHEEYFADNAEALEKLPRIASLIKPPACTACPLFAQIDGIGYCGWAACFDRKKEATDEADLHKVSESTGIAIYDPADGDKIQLRIHKDKHRAAFTKKHKDLRLLRGGQNYMNFGDIPNDIKVVAVGELYKTWKKAAEQSRQDKPAQHDAVDYERLRAIRKIHDAQISIFTWEQAIPAFSKLLDGVTCTDLLHRIDEELRTGSILEFPETGRFQSDKDLVKMKKPAQLDLMRKRILFQTLESRMKNDEVQKIRNSKTPVSLFAKYLQGLASSWGVKLPKDFMEQAATHDEAVKIAITELDNADGKAAK